MVEVTSPGQGGLPADNLSNDEGSRLERIFDTALEDTRTEDTNVVVEKLREYMPEIKYAARVAKSQMNLDFGGQVATSDNQFIMTTDSAALFGMDDWDNQFSQGNQTLTAGSTNDWIHENQYEDSSGTQWGGTGGDPLTVGNEVVHLIVGIGSLHPDPKITRAKFHLNDTPRTTVETEYAFRQTDIQIQWLNAPVLLGSEDEFYSEVFSSVAGEDVPYLKTVSFLANREARALDPSNVRDTSGTNTEEPISR